MSSMKYIFIGLLLLFQVIKSSVGQGINSASITIKLCEYYQCPEKSSQNISFEVSPLFDELTPSTSDNYKIIIDSSGYYYFQTGQCVLEIPEHDVTFDLLFDSEYRFSLSRKEYRTYLRLVSRAPVTATLPLSSNRAQIIRCTEILSTNFRFRIETFSIGYEQRTHLNPAEPEAEPKYSYMLYTRKYTSIPNRPAFYPPGPDKLTWPASFTSKSYGSISLTWEKYTFRSDILKLVRVSFAISDPVFKDNGILRKSGLLGQSTPDSSPRLLQHDQITLIQGCGTTGYSSEDGFVSTQQLFVDGIAIPNQYYELELAKTRGRFFEARIVLKILKDISFSTPTPLFEILFTNIKALEFAHAKSLHQITGNYIRSHVVSDRSNDWGDPNTQPYISFDLPSAVSTKTYELQPLIANPSPPDVLRLQLPYPKDLSALELGPFRVLFSLTKPMINSPISITLQFPSNISYVDTKSLCSIHSMVGSQHHTSNGDGLSSERKTYPLEPYFIMQNDFDIFENMYPLLVMSRLNYTNPSVTLAPYTTHMLECTDMRLAPLPLMLTAVAPYKISQPHGHSYSSKYVLAIYHPPFYENTKNVDDTRGSHISSLNHESFVQLPKLSAMKHAFCGLFCLSYGISWRLNERETNAIRFLVAPMQTFVSSDTTVKAWDSSMTLRIVLPSIVSSKLSINFPSCTTWVSTSPIESLSGNLSVMDYLSHPNFLEALTTPPPLSMEPLTVAPHSLFQTRFPAPVKTSVPECPGCFRTLNALEVTPIVGQEDLNVTAVMIQCNNTGRIEPFDFGMMKVTMIKKTTTTTPPIEVVVESNDNMLARNSSYYFAKENDPRLTLQDFFFLTSQYNKNLGISRFRGPDMELPSFPDHIMSYTLDYSSDVVHEIIFPSPRGLIQVHQRDKNSLTNARPAYQLDYTFTNILLILAENIGIIDSTSVEGNGNISLSTFVDRLHDVSMTIEPKWSYAWTAELQPRPANGKLPIKTLYLTISFHVVDDDRPNEDILIYSFTEIGNLTQTIMPLPSLEKTMYTSSQFSDIITQQLSFTVNWRYYSEMINSSLQSNGIADLSLKNLVHSRKRVMMKVSAPTIYSQNLRTEDFSYKSAFVNENPSLMFATFLGYYSISIHSTVKDTMNSYQRTKARDIWAVTSCDIDFILPSFEDFARTLKWRAPEDFPPNTSKASISLYNSMTYKAHEKLWCSPPLTSNFKTYDLSHNGDGVVEKQPEGDDWEWNAWDSRYGNILPPTMYILQNVNNPSLFDLHITIQPPFFIVGPNDLLLHFIQIDVSLPRDLVTSGKSTNCQWGLDVAPGKLDDPDWQTSSSFVEQFDSSLMRSRLTTRVFSNNSIKERFFPNFLTEKSLESSWDHLTANFQVPSKLHIKCQSFALKADETGSLYPRAESLPISISSFGNTFGRSKKMHFLGLRTLDSSNNLIEAPSTLVEKSWYKFTSLTNGSVSDLEFHFEQSIIDIMEYDLFEMYIPASITIPLGSDQYVAPSCHLTQLQNASDNSELYSITSNLETFTKLKPTGDETMLLSLHFTSRKKHVDDVDTKLRKNVHVGIIPRESNFVFRCQGFISQPTPPHIEFAMASSSLGPINYSIKRPLSLSSLKTLGFGQMIKPSSSLHLNPFGELISSMSVSANDIRPNGNLVFFNATIAPFRMTSPPPDTAVKLSLDDEDKEEELLRPGFTEGNVLMAILPSEWILNQLPLNRISCFFKMYHFGKLGPYHATSRNISGFKVPYAPSMTRFVIKSFGSGKNQFHVVAMQLGPLMSDNSVNYTSVKTNTNFMDLTNLNDPKYDVDALSMVCMSDFRNPVSKDDDSPFTTNSPMATFVPLAFVKRLEANSSQRLHGNLLLFPSWAHLEKAFDEYLIQNNTVFSKAIQNLTKYHRSHVEASVVNYTHQRAIGWKSRSVLKQNLRFLSNKPLTLEELGFVERIWSQRLQEDDIDIPVSSPFSTEPIEISRVFTLTTSVFKQQLEQFSYFSQTSTVLYPTLPSHAEFFEMTPQIQSIETFSTLNVSIMFDAVSFGVTEQQTKDIISTLLAAVAQEMVDKLNRPMISGLNAGSLVIPEFCYDKVYSFAEQAISANETDLDCGGMYCSQCQINERCLWDSDCITLSCDKTTYTCSIHSPSHQSDAQQQIEWQKTGQPFHIFDKSPFIDPLNSLMQRLDPNNEWNIDFP